MNCPQKISLAEMRASGVRGLLVYCSDYHCSHWIAISGDQWPDDVRLSEVHGKAPDKSLALRCTISSTLWDDLYNFMEETVASPQRPWQA